MLGRDETRAAALAEEIADRQGIPAKAFGLSQAALANVDIICTTTHSPTPVLRGEWLEPGMHITSVGLHASGRELDGEVLQRSLVVVETRAAALAPPPSGSNDLHLAIRDGLIGPDHIHAEIGELVSGMRPGRASPDQITLYKSVGVAVEDAVAAQWVLDAALRQRVGKEIQI